MSIIGIDVGFYIHTWINVMLLTLHLCKIERFQTVCNIYNFIYWILDTILLMNSKRAYGIFLVSSFFLSFFPVFRRLLKDIDISICNLTKKKLSIIENYFKCYSRLHSFKPFRFRFFVNLRRMEKVELSWWKYSPAEIVFACQFLVCHFVNFWFIYFYSSGLKWEISLKAFDESNKLGKKTKRSNLKSITAKICTDLRSNAHQVGFRIKIWICVRRKTTISIISRRFRSFFFRLLP